MGSGLVGLHRKAVLPGASFTRTWRAWRGTLSRVSKAPDVEAPEIQKIKSYDEYGDGTQPGPGDCF